MINFGFLLFYPIGGVGCSITTMEEVFLKVGEQGGEEEGEVHRVDLKTRLGERNVRNLVLRQEKSIDTALVTLKPEGGFVALPVERNTGFTLKKQQFFSLLKKRFFHSTRNKKTMFSQLFPPLLFTFLALVIAQESNNGTTNPTPRDLSALQTIYGADTTIWLLNQTWTAPDTTTTTTATTTIKTTANTTNITTTTTTTTATTTPTIDISITQFINAANNYFGNVSSIATQPTLAPAVFPNTSTFLIQTAGPTTPDVARFNARNLVLLEFKPDPTAPVVGWFNGQAYHSVAEVLNAVDGVVAFYFNASIVIKATNSPLPQTITEASQSNQESGQGFGIAFNIVFGMAPLVTSFVLFLVDERACKAKLVQFVSGVSALSYWTSSFLWDYINFLIPSFGCLLLFLVFSIEQYSGANVTYVIMLFFAYGWAVIPMMYCLTFLFRNASLAYTLLCLLNIVTGLAAMVTVQILGAVSPDSVSTVKNVFLMLPNYCFGQGISDIYSNYESISVIQALINDQVTQPFCSTVEACCIAIANADTPSIPPTTRCNTNFLSTTYPGIGMYLLCMVGQGFVFFAIVLFIESGIISKIRQWLKRVKVMPIRPREDLDVIAERERVQEIMAHRQLMSVNGGSAAIAATSVAVVDNISKVFELGSRRKVAVDHLSFEVQSEECFGLLGVNGAGKTTTFRILTGDEHATSGNAYIAGFNVAEKVTLPFFFKIFFFIIIIK